MISMKMTYENVLDPRHVDGETPELDLGSFAAVDQKKPLMYMQYLSGWKSC